ncbi:MAG: T9SS type A sorting domain-containing protein [Flavobacteriales bacterium]
MKHSLIFWLFLCFPIVSLAQDARDAIVGNYSVSKQGTGGLGTIWMDTLIVRKNISDSSQIFIEVKNGSGDYLYDFHPSDSSFTHPDFPDLIHGAYFPNDSIWIYQWLFINSPPYAYEFQGFKTESTVGIADNAANKNLIQIISNIGRNSVTIQYRELRGATLLELYDISGKKVWSQRHFSSTGKGSVSINLTSLKTGIYILRARNNGRVLSKKIINATQ